MFWPYPDLHIICCHEWIPFAKWIIGFDGLMELVPIYTIVIAVVMNYRAQGSWIGNAWAMLFLMYGVSACLWCKASYVRHQKFSNAERSINRCTSALYASAAELWYWQGTTAIVQHFCTHISDSCTARVRILVPSVRAEGSLRPLVDYKYNSVWDGVGIMSYRYKISECSM